MISATAILISSGILPLLHANAILASLIILVINNANASMVGCTMVVYHQQHVLAQLPAQSLTVIATTVLVFNSIMVQLLIRLPVSA
jgi:hypothetical protein